MPDYTKKIKVSLDLDSNRISNASLLNCSIDGYKIVVCTQTEYNNLQTKDQYTIYFIKGS